MIKKIMTVSCAIFIFFAVQAKDPGVVVKSFSGPSCCPRGLTYGEKHLWMLDRKLNKIFQIDKDNGKVISEIPTPGFHGAGLTYIKGFLFVVDRDRKVIYRLNTKTKIVDKVLKIAIRSPRGLAYDGAHLLVADAKKNNIYMLDPDDGTLIKYFKSPSTSVTGMTFDGKYLWVADRNKDEIYMMDVDKEAVINIFPSPGPHPYGLAYDGKYLWNVDYQTRKIYKLNIETKKKVIHYEKKSLKIEYSIQFLSQGPDNIKNADFYIAVPTDYYNQKITSSLEFFPKPQEIKFDNWGQKVAHFNFRNIKPGTNLVPRMVVKADLYKTNFWIMPEKVEGLDKVPLKIKKKYLKDSVTYRINDPKIKEAAIKAIGKETNTYWKARKIYQFVREMLDYKLKGGWDSVPILLERGTGSCSEYSFVFIALCRAVGIPARYVGGIVTRGDDAFVDNVFHRWAEVYLPGYGWVTVDPDRGDKESLRGQALGFGNLGNTLLITTKSGGKSDFLDWKYNGNVKWQFIGNSRVYTEQIGELSPIGESDAN